MAKATLINQAGQKQVVDVGSQQAQQLFGQGYSLMGSAPVVPQGATKISGPSGLQGLNESQIFRQGQDIYKLPELPIFRQGQDIYKLPELPKTVSSENFTSPGMDAPVIDTTPDVSGLMAGIQTSNKGIQSQLEAQAKALQSQQKKSAIDTQIEQYSKEIKTAQRDLQEQKLDQYGAGQNLAQVQALMPQIARLEADFNKIAEENQNRPISSRIIGGTQDRLQRQKAIELAGLSAVAQAYQGNVEMARTMAQDAVNAQYQDQENYFTALKTQLSSIENDLSREEKVKAEQLNTVIAERERLITEEKEKANNINNLAISAAQNGADQATVQKIMKSSDYITAIGLASPFLNPEDSKWVESDITDANGNPLLFNSTTGEYKNSVGTSTSDIFFTDANGDSWNIAGWATDQTKPAQMNVIAKRIGKVTEENIDEKVKEFTPGLTADMIKEASAMSGVSWEALMTMVNQESQGGMSNVAKDNNNFGGLTWSSGTQWQNEPYNGSKGTERSVAEGGNYIKFPTKQQGLNAMAALMASYGKIDTTLQQPDEVIGLVELVRTGQLTPKEALGQVSEKNRNILTEQLSKIEIEKVISSYTEEMKNRTLESVDELLTQVNPYTVGFGVLAKGIPTSQARSFAAQLDTLKANIAFGELTAMREASKTGGALGQVSDREGKLLANALGALDQGQSPEQFKAQLEKIKNSINKWKQEVNQYSSQSNISTVDLTDLNFKFE